MINDKAVKVIKIVFNSLFSRYQNNIVKLIKDSEFVLDYILFFAL